MESNQDFQNKFKNFWQCILKPNTIWNGRLISNELIPVQLNQITELLIDDLELLANELFKQENIPVLIDVIQSVNVRTNGSSELPSVCGFEVF